MTGWARRGAWGLVLLVLGSWLVAFVLAGVGVAPSAGGPDPSAGGGQLGGVRDDLGDDVGGEDPPQVVLIGIPGLTWDVIDDSTTPTLAEVAREGGSAALVLRGTHEVTCAADAWLTVGAGQRAATGVEGCEGAPSDAPAGDRSAPPPVEEVVDDEGVDAGIWTRWQEAAGRQSLVAELGTLAGLAEDGGTCVAAYGTDAVLGAAGPDGRAATAATWAGGTTSPAAPGSAECRVHLVSLPRTSPTEADAAVEAVRSDLPSGTTLVVAGLGHTAGRAEAMALVVHPVGAGTGAVLSSGSTRQRGLAQLTDLTPTLLHLAGVELPAAGSTALAGQLLTAQAAGDHGPGQVRDLAAGVTLAKSSVLRVLGALGVVLVPLLVVVAVLRLGRVAAATATLAMAVPVATFLAGLLPWWRADTPVTVLTLLVAGIAALVAGLAWAGSWRRDPLAPPAVVAAVSLAVLGVDMMWSSRLGLVSVLGLQPVTAGRFYGQGNVGFGIALGAFVVLAAALLTWLRPREDGSAEHRGGPAERPSRAGRSREGAVAVALLGGAFTVVGAAPWGGADFGGVPAMVVVTGLLVMAALGLRRDARGLLVLGLLGILVAATAMVLDWLRGPGRRTHLGDFVQRVIDGEALDVVTRKLDQSLGILLSYPASWLAVVALVLVVVVVVRRPGWSEPLWRQGGVHPALVAGLVGIVLAWALNDSGIAAAALALTMLIAASLQVLGRAPTEGEQPGWVRRPTSSPPA